MKFPFLQSTKKALIDISRLVLFLCNSKGYNGKMDRKKPRNDRVFGQKGNIMDDKWHKRSKRWQSAQFTGMQQLYGEKPANLLVAARTQKSSANTPVKTKRVRNRKIEADMQIALVAWCHARDLFIISIPNEGRRSIYTATLLKAMGLYPGAADLFLLERSKDNAYRGFFIELKAPGQKPRENQLQFGQRARNNGYKYEFYDNAEEAKHAITDYLDMEIEI